MKRITHWAAILVALTYIAIASIPAERYIFAPGEPIFLDADQGTAPELIFSREVFRSATIEYSTATRTADNGPQATTACEGNNGAGFTYQIVSGPLTGKDLKWWTSGNDLCAKLPPGEYYNITTWTIPRPMEAILPKSWHSTIFVHLLPPKKIERQSRVFEILPL